MEKWREACGRAAEGFGRRGDIPFYSSALSALAGECADDMGKSGRIAEAAVAMLADALMDMDLQGYAERPEKAAGELERFVSSIAYADALGRLRAAMPTFETRLLGEIDGADPDALPAVPENLVGPSDTATCTIDILDGSQEGNREVLDECAAMMTDDDPDIGDFCFITFMLRDGSPKTGIFCKIRDSAGPGCVGASLFRLQARTPHRARRIEMAGSRVPRDSTWVAAVSPWMPFMVESQGGIHGGIR